MVVPTATVCAEQRVVQEVLRPSGAQTLQYLHPVGLLRASFRPPEAICAIRTLWRHRGSLLEMAAEHILHMQKALSQMNLQLHHVLSDITGTSGQCHPLGPARSCRTGATLS